MLYALASELRTSLDFLFGVALPGDAVLMTAHGDGHARAGPDGTGAIYAINATVLVEAREKLHTLLDNLSPESALGKRAERFEMLQRHDETDSARALFLLGGSQIEWARGQNEP